jgi:hypothetical protein
MRNPLRERIIALVIGGKCLYNNGMKISNSLLKVDRTAFSVTSLSDQSDERKYWLSRSAIERLQAIELIRQTVYGYTNTTTRLQRFFEVAELIPS